MHRRKVLYELEFGSPKAIGGKARAIKAGENVANAIIADAYSTKAAELAGVSERTISRTFLDILSPTGAALAVGG